MDALIRWHGRGENIKDECLQDNVPTMLWLLSGLHIDITQQCIYTHQTWPLLSYRWTSLARCRKTIPDWQPFSFLNWAFQWFCNLRQMLPCEETSRGGRKVTKEITSFCSLIDWSSIALNLLYIQCSKICLNRKQVQNKILNRKPDIVQHKFEINEVLSCCFTRKTWMLCLITSC